jgi:glycopeptide antibiotics resistance protein
MAEQPALLVENVTRLLLTQNGNTNPPTHTIGNNARAAPIKKFLDDIDYEFFKQQLIVSFKARGLFYIIDGSTNPDDIDDIAMNQATSLIVTAITRSINKNSKNVTYPFGIHQIEI